MKYENWLMHFNPNHDPRNGQFAKKSGSGLGKAAAIGALTGAGLTIRSSIMKDSVARNGGLAGLVATGIGGIMFAGIGALSTTLAKFGKNKIDNITNREPSSSTVRRIAESTALGAVGSAAIIKSANLISGDKSGNGIPNLKLIGATAMAAGLATAGKIGIEKFKESRYKKNKN